MTQIYDESVLTPVTVIEAGPCRVVAIKTQDRDGYEAVQLSFGEVKERKLSKAESGHLKKHQAPREPSSARIFKKDGDVAVGQIVKVDMFKKGDWVDVVGVSKGKGFQGVVNAIIIRAAPSPMGRCFTARRARLGAARTPRVSGRTRLAGHMGAERVTVNA